MLEDFHLHHLVIHLRRGCAGRRVQAAEWAVNARLLLRLDGDGPNVLCLLDSRVPALLGGSGSVLADAVKLAPCSAVDERLRGTILRDMKKTPDDRVIVLEFGSATAVEARLFFEARPIVPFIHLSGPDGGIAWSMGANRPDAPAAGGPDQSGGRPRRVPATREAAEPVLREADPAEWARMLPRRFQGLSPTLAEEIRQRAPGQDSRALAAAIEETSAEAFAASSRFLLYTRRPWLPGEFTLHPRRDFTLSSFPLRCRTDWPVQPEAGPADAVTRWVAYTLEYLAFETRKNQLLAALRKAAGARDKKIYALESELASARRHEFSGRHGELILANLHRFGANFRGEALEVEDLYAPVPATVSIPLDPEKNLRENAELCFRRHRKARAALARLPAELEAARAAAAEFADIVAAAREAATREALDRLAPAVPERAARRMAVTIREDRQEKSVQFRRFVTASGLAVLVGRSAAENDRLSFRVARPDDFWFHAADVTGSHVLLLWGKKSEPPEADLHQAAAVAAWYSQGRKAPRLEVHGTRAKFVRKVKGAPGRASLAKARTFRVAPELPTGDPAGSS